MASNETIYMYRSVKSLKVGVARLVLKKTQGAFYKMDGGNKSWKSEEVSATDDASTEQLNPLAVSVFNMTSNISECARTF